MVMTTEQLIQKIGQEADVDFANNRVYKALSVYVQGTDRIASANSCYFDNDLYFIVSLNNIEDTAKNRVLITRYKTFGRLETEVIKSSSIVNISFSKKLFKKRTLNFETTNKKYVFKQFKFDNQIDRLINSL